MSEALNNPVARRRREINTDDMQIGQKDEIDLEVPLVHGERLADVAGDVSHNKSYLEALAFMEEPIKIMINPTGQKNAETHVLVQVNGKGAELLIDGRWLTVGWLQINTPLITKRKYVEILVRSKSDSVTTYHEDATVQTPRNTVRRETSANYPLSVLQDNNPLGAEWLQRAMMNH